ncbi:hypothetical protein HPP92_016286 [Vanilla planifolia]|uniref:Phosphatidylinositol-glycan biosynthesis class W protein n=1 Tax=Vanilla planifolia TaxID=51239 RepID=A0A835QEH9_VANPL|nr:hypothetical protein HPP92_016286 [Vanilla planifolia]
MVMDFFAKPLNSNKALKEEFVSNLTGSSMLEIAALSIIIPALFLIRKWSSIYSRSALADAKIDNGKTYDITPSIYIDFWSVASELAKDFAFIFLSIILVLTVLAEWAYFLAIILVTVLLFWFFTKRHSFPALNATPGPQFSRLSILSYRVSVVVVTFVCILAVDFKIFPRRLGKTEIYGTGLMDLGVGSFVVANSLVSKQARGIMSVNLKAALQAISPLVLLGAGRLIFTSGVDYQVHVGEYGVHWNFFFTLAAVTLLTYVIRIHPKYCGLFGSTILLVYQISLTYGLNEYLLSNRRASDIVSQNKRRRIQCIWSLTIILDRYVERVSRRMCNLAYVTFVLAQNLQVLSVLMLAEFIPAKRPLLLEEAFNQNLLGSFLLANVLTGMVNMGMDTLAASSLQAFVILVGYALFLTVVVIFFWFHGIKLKFW